MLICNNEGRIEIVSGTEARSAEVLKGDTFDATSEDQYRYFGTLETKNGFIHEPGLSGKRFEPYFVGKPKIECAVLKENIKEEPHNFWATWSRTKLNKN